jgi:hypothetical protein
MRLEFNESANSRRTALAHGDTHPVGWRRNLRRVESLDAHDDPVASLALLADFYEASERDACHRMLQDRMCDTQSLQRRNGKSERGCSNA